MTCALTALRGKKTFFFCSLLKSAKKPVGFTRGVNVLWFILNAFISVERLFYSFFGVRSVLIRNLAL